MIDVEKHCPNCGKITSLKKNFEGYFGILKKPLLFSLTFSAILFVPSYILIFGEPFYIPLLFICFLGLFSIFTTLLFFIQYQRTIFSEETPEPIIDNSLDRRSLLIEKRVSELNNRIKRIDQVLDKIKNNDGRNLQEVRIKLLSAREIVTGQFARYELQKRKIELVRLQNSVSPYLFSIHRLNQFETEDGLTAIEVTKTNLDKIRQNLTSYAAIEFPAQTANEKEHFLSQLAETEDSCEKLREALLSKQAARALRGIAPIEENLKLPSAKDIVHSTETFNLQTTLTDFSESFEELEREYRRVRAESEVSQKLLEN